MNGQKPGIPMKNLALFMLASLVIMFAYTWIENKYFPKAKTATAEQKLQAANLAGQIGSLAPAGTGVGDVWAFAAREIDRQIPPPDRTKALGAFEEERKKVAAAAPKPVVKAFKAELVELGDDNFNLRVRFTTRGGGVDRVIVPVFPHADKYGKEVKGADGKPQPLHLILSPEDMSQEERNDLPHDALLPSFLFYHYASPEEPRPEPIMAEKEWKVVERPKEINADVQTIAFAADLPEFGVRVTKTFTLSRRDYHVGLTLKIERLPGKSPKPLRYQLSGGHGLPIEGVWYTGVFRNFVVGLKDGKGNVKRHIETGAQVVTNLGSERVERSDGEIQYVAAAGQYFVSATCVDETQADRTFIDAARGTVEDNGFPKDKPMLADICGRLISKSLDVGETPIEHKFVLYHGPVKVRQLYQVEGFPVDDATVERYERALNLRTLTDFHSDNMLGRFANFIGWSDLTIAFTNIMHAVLGFLMRTLQVPVLAILALTVMVRLLLMPLSRRQTANMQKMQEKMATLQPKLKELETKYKDDQSELHKAKMKLMMEHGINPAAQLGGCLLLFAQMPIFMGLYYSLQENVFFRLKSFLWIDNLAAPDMLIPWGEKIWYIADPASLGSWYYLGPYFNILPFLAVGLMLVQQWLMTPPPADEQQAQQQKLMKWMMILFAFFFYKTPSGLVLYFIVSSTWGLLERKLFPKKPSSSTSGGGGSGGGGGGDGGGNGAKLKDKPKPPTETWLQRKMREVLEAAEKRDNTTRRGPAPKKVKPR